MSSAFLHHTPGFLVSTDLYSHFLCTQADSDAINATAPKNRLKLPLKLL